MKPCNECFKSRTHELIFILTEMQSYHRLHALGITPEHYHDKLLSRDWYQNIYSQLTTTTESNLSPEKVKCALVELDKLHRGMCIQFSPVVSVQ